MLTLLIVFAAILVAGLGFWFYNRRQVSALAEKIDDKNAVINALRNHVDQTDVEETLITTDVSTTTKIERAENLTPTVEQVLSEKKPNKNKNKNRDNGNKNFNQKKQKQNAKEEFSSEKKNRPKPRKKNKPQQ